MSGWEPFLQLGVGGVLLMVLWLIVDRGALRTKFEASAWESRAIRAEEQVDRLLPAVAALNDTVIKMVDQNKLMLEAFQRFTDRIHAIQLIPPSEIER
jgi:hypothetical protein